MRFIYIDYAGLGQESLDAAEASHCAQDQGKYWEYHDQLFTNVKGENVGSFKRENLIRFASELKLDVPTFTQCVDSNKYQDFVIGSTQEARSLGIEGTPTIVVNSQLVPGFVPFSELQPIIEEELKT